MARLSCCCPSILVLLVGCARPDARFPQFVQDQLVVGTIAAEVGAVLEAALAGQPVGEARLTAPCTGGGSMQVTGTLGADGSVDLTLGLHDCAIEHAEFDGGSAASLTIAGPMTFRLAMDDATGLPREDLHSDALDFDGTVTRQGEVRDAQDFCALSVTLLTTHFSVALLGQVCGRDTTASLAHTACRI